ncbi:MAG: DegV family protein [Lachnospiraceae bacterium]|nr:DegV family protein [Lachnospiraceae bacterium]
MVRRLIADSCADFTPEKKEWTDVRLVPLTLTVDKEDIVDDETFCQKKFLEKMRRSLECPRSACPSPERYMREFEGADEIFVVTLSKHLSGSYQSAMLAKQMYEEQHPEVKIEVVDSWSASVGESVIVLKLRSLLDRFNFEEIVKKITTFRNNAQTKFVLEDLDVFIKNGRLTQVQAILCNALNIKPLLAGKEGQIVKLDQARGVERALKKLVDAVVADVKEATTRTLAIAHCNHPARAEAVKQMIMSRVPFKECMIVNTGGVSTMYANEGGIIVAY